MGTTYIMHESGQKCVRFGKKKLNKRDLLEDLGKYQGIILKLIFKKYVGGGGGMDWIYVIENLVKQQAVVNMIIKKINNYLIKKW